MFTGLDFHISCGNLGAQQFVLKHTICSLLVLNRRLHFRVQAMALMRQLGGKESTTAGICISSEIISSG